MTRQHARRALSAVAFGLLISLGAWKGYRIWGPGPGLGRNHFVSVPAGAKTIDVARLLHAEGVIRSEWDFLLIARLARRSFYPGGYSLGDRESLWRTLARVHAPPPTVNVTIPEGLAAREIARLLESKRICQAEDFLRATSSATLVTLSSDPTRAGLEGYFFPDTYRFYTGMRAEDVSKTLVNRMLTVLSGYDERLRRTGLSRHQLLTLASIVEREAGLHDRRIVASVFRNRLRIGMKLESCATALYARGDWGKEPLRRIDLERQHPYNTYVVAGLPPGPICSPGRAAIEAVLDPEQTDLLFFVSRGDGTHVFSRTRSEHEGWVRLLRH